MHSLPSGSVQACSSCLAPPLPRRPRQVHRRRGGVDADGAVGVRAGRAHVHAGATAGAGAAAAGANGRGGAGSATVKKKMFAKNVNSNLRQ